MTYTIIVSPEAQAQLDSLYDHIASSASTTTAFRFTDALLGQLDTLRQFPNQGTRRDDILPGLRTCGFRRRVTIAFAVEPDKVLVLGVFYGGQDFEALLRED